MSVFCTNFAFPTYAIGPISYIYIRSILRDNSRLRKKDIWHFIPMIVYFLASLPYILSSYSFKVNIAKAIIADPGFLAEYRFTILSNWFSIPGLYLSRPLLAFAYTVASGIMLYKHFRLHKPLDNNIGEQIVYRWLMTFLGFQLLLFISYIFYIFGAFDVAGSSLSLSEDVINFTSSIGLIGLIISPFLFPRILYGLPNISVTGFTPKHDIIEEKELPIKKEPNYNEDYMRFINEKVDECMNKHQLYLQKDLNLPKISVLLNIPTHHLAYFFSSYLKTTFNDYRNLFRVEHAKRLLIDHKATMITLEAVGLLSGFSNRNTFSRVFKEQVGISPSTFVLEFNK
ncbi:MAG: helix-turn-helix domain-containing protein [Ferruginibacter sp.]